MTETARHVDAEHTRIYSAETGLPAIYYKSNMDVNTDGAARSYHPDDPRGRERALNNIANAITRIFDAEGDDITCEPRSGACFQTFIATFEAARDSRYDPVGHPRIETTHIIPWRRDEALGRDVPCTITEGPAAGYFVSQTAVVVDDSRDICDQARYLDSLTFNAQVLPGAARWRAQGVVTDGTDLVVARDAQTGRIAFGINGDVGPADKLGEGSIAFAAALAGLTLTGSEGASGIRRLVRPDVEYLVFPTRDVRKLAGAGYTQADINRFAAEAFAAWGGEERLAACRSLAR